MEQLLKEVHELASREYDRASEKWGGTFTNAHEGYAVLKEEYEEARDASKTFSTNFHEYWAEIKNNSFRFRDVLLKRMLNLAENSAAEWIQVCAMCMKAMASNEGGE